MAVSDENMIGVLIRLCAYKIEYGNDTNIEITYRVIPVVFCSSTSRHCSPYNRKWRGRIVVGAYTP